MKLKYNVLSKIVTDGYIYCQIKKGIYGLKQVARLTYDDLVIHLKNMVITRTKSVKISGLTKPEK